VRQPHFFSFFFALPSVNMPTRGGIFRAACGSGLAILHTLASAFSIERFDPKVGPAKERLTLVCLSYQDSMLVGHMDTHDFPEHERYAP
jgi:hypothetical protein